MKIFFLFFLGVLIIVGVILFRQSMVKQTPPSSKKIEIVASFYPLAEFARQVGGEAVSVRTIVPSGVEPHDYEPTPKDIIAAHASDLFLYQGAGFDAWAEKIHPELEANGVNVIAMTSSFDLLNNDAPEDEGRGDPHIWLDPVFAIQEVEIIRDAMIRIDSARQSFYQQQAAASIDKLRGLDQDYRNSLSSCKLHHVIASHAAFYYLAQRYRFSVFAIAGLSPEAEPTPKHLADLAQLAKEKGIRHIFFETLTSPKIAETLATEVGASTLVFNPIEGLTEEEQTSGEDYFSIMQNNLTALQIAMQCSSI